MTVPAVGGDPATLRLAAGRAKASEMMPYLSAALFAIKPIKTPGYGTFGVDKRWRMYWDPAFCETLSVAEVAAVWLHECGHVLREHSRRFEAMLEPDSRHKLWNIAGDAAINADLRDAGVSLPVKPWYPEKIVGAERGSTTEQMYRLLCDSPFMNRVKKERTPQLMLLPNAVRYDYATPVTITAGTVEKMFDATTTVKIVDAAGVEQQGAIANISVRNERTFAFNLVTSVPAGDYAVVAECNGKIIAGGFHVVSPKITLRPDYLPRNYTNPKVVVVGQYTRFTAHTVVEVLDEAGTVLPIVSDVRNQSAEYMTFEVPPTMPDGMYIVRVTAGTEVCEAPLPIGLPHLEISPQQLPSGFIPPIKIVGVGEDIVFDANTTVELTMVTPTGTQPVPASAVTNVNVTSDTDVSFDLAETLDDGQYFVIAQSGTEKAVATLTVGGDDGDDGGGGEGESGEEGEEGENGSGSGKGGKGEGDEDDLPDCGSGSGGARRKHELPDDGNDDGSIDEGRGHLIRNQVAKQIKEHSKSRGNVPGGWERWAELTLNPRVDWRKELNSVVRRTAANVAGLRDYTYSKPSRRSSSMPQIVLPAMRQPRPPLVYVIVDTSGSMSDAMLGQCLTEIGEIVSRVSSKGGDPVKIIACDAAAAEVQTIRSVKNVSLTGGGGTDMRVGIRQAAESRPKADLIITLTDGETPWPDVAPPENPRARYVAVLVAGEASYSQVPDFMHKIVIDEDYLSGQ